MKKYVMLALAAILSLGISISAQNQQMRSGQGREGGQRMQSTPTERADRLAKQLELTDVEKAKLIEMYENQDANREKVKNEKPQANTDRKAQFEEQRKTDDAELEKIIGKEKFEKYLSIRVEREKKMRERAQNNEKPKQEGTGRQEIK